MLILNDKRTTIRPNNNQSLIVACLSIRLARIAEAGLITANQSNPFWSKRHAMQSINGSRTINPLF